MTLAAAPTPAPFGDPSNPAPAHTGPVAIDLDGGATIIHGDALAALRTLADNSIDAIVTDPPYGLSKEPDIAEVLTHWLAGDDYIHTGRGFMGNTWDSFVPGPSVWRDAFRVLKPGGYAAVFASARTLDLMMVALRLAGFTVVDTLSWTFGQGFPKSLDLGKAFAKAGDDENAAKYAGYGTALKPGHEPIALVRKPLVGTYIENVATHGTGGLNIDGCRIKNTTGDGSREGEESAQARYTEKGGTNFAATPGPRGGAPEGRFPANVVFTHAAACVEVGTATVKAPVINRFTDGAKPFGGGAGHEFTSVQTGDADGNETVAVFDCVDGCPVKELDAQSGIRTSGKPGVYKGTPNRSAAYGAESRKAGEQMTGFGDSGGASRFYPTFKYAQKAVAEERATVWVPPAECVAAGHSPDPHAPDTPWIVASPTATSCTECGAHWVAYQHPTVKPVPLMEWLIRLVTPEGGTVLDLFAGTGSTGVAAVAEGFRPVLIERDGVHVAMTHKRMTEPIQTSLFGV